MEFCNVWNVKICKIYFLFQVGAFTATYDEDSEWSQGLISAVSHGETFHLLFDRNVHPCTS